MTISFRVLLTAACMTACIGGTLTFAGEGHVDSESRQEEPAPFVDAASAFPAP